MIAFTYLAVQVIIWQSADISVNIDSGKDSGNKEVSISVLNTAGATLLFYENDQVSGKIEYLSEDGWVEYCDVCYTSGNIQAISPEYGGIFAELSPGEDWKVTIPKEKVAGMKDGTYRIKMTYITESNYNKYLEMAYKENLENPRPDESFFDESFDTSDASGFVGTTSKAEGNKDKYAEDKDEEEFLAADYSEVFIKTFEYSAPEQMVQLVSDVSDMEE